MDYWQRVRLCLEAAIQSASLLWPVAKLNLWYQHSKNEAPKVDNQVDVCDKIPIAGSSF